MLAVDIFHLSPDGMAVARPGSGASLRGLFIIQDREQQEACHTLGTAQDPKHINSL